MPYCRELNSLQKRYTALLHSTNTFSENKIIRSLVGGKVDGKFYLAPGVRNRKFYLAPGMRNGKIYFAPNDSYEKFYLAVKGLNAPALSTLHMDNDNEFQISGPEHENLLAAVFVLVLGNTSSCLSVEINIRDGAYG